MKRLAKMVNMHIVDSSGMNKHTAQVEIPRAELDEIQADLAKIIKFCAKSQNKHRRYYVETLKTLRDSIVWEMMLTREDDTDENTRNFIHPDYR
jgi:hypothetical protein